MPSFAKEHSIVNVTRPLSCESQSDCAVRSRMNRSLSAWILEMMLLRTSESCLKAAVTSLSNVIFAVKAPRDGKTVYVCSDWKEVTYRTMEGNDKTVTIRTGYEIIERTIDKYGQFLLPADLEVNTWWTNTGMEDSEVIQNYHAHGECEQFHSEIKTDMDVERLPSGKFDTNELVLELTILAYNILRMIGQETIGRRKTRHKVHRRRLRTVISNMILMARQVKEHARQLIMGLGQSNVWRHTFAEIYTAFAQFSL